MGEFEAVFPEILWPWLPEVQDRVRHQPAYNPASTGSQLYGDVDDSNSDGLELDELSTSD